MKSYHRLLAAKLILLVSRRGDSPTALAAAQVDPTEHQKFADELTSLLYTKENECSSALGVSMAFSLIYPGSTNSATDEIRDTLGYPEGSTMQLMWEDTTQRMLSSSSGQCVGGEWDGVCESEAPLLQIANSVWLDDGELSILTMSWWLAATRSKLTLKQRTLLSS